MSPRALTTSSRSAPDAGKEEDVIHLIRSAAARFGGLDIVFANAGVSGGLASLFDQSPEDWAEILRINLIGPFLAIKHAAPLIKERGGGSIICTASVAGHPIGRGRPGLFGVEGGGHQPGQGRRAAIGRLERSRQRDLPGPY
jgi:NAD(P)-dependent dehydrogenase (short-subunit alcohol dehydrogenase family)